MQDFDSAEPVEVPFKINGVEFVIREPDEATASRYETARVKALKHDDEGKFLGVANDDALSSLRSILIGGCLFKKGEAKPVGAEAVSAMPRRVTERVWAECIRMYEAAFESAKN